MNLNLNDIKHFLFKHDNFLILMHQNPDGDTIGSGFGLYYGLKSIGKNARVLCSDDIPGIYEFLKKEYQEIDFIEQFIISVDIGSENLFGDSLEKYKGSVDLNIDHHFSNENFAKYNYVDATSASTSQIIYEILDKLDIDLSVIMGKCLYTGICTDTGCFRYRNTTSKTHMIASKLLELDFDHSEIVYNLMESKSLQKLELEKHIINNMKFYFDGIVGIAYITQDMIEKSGASPYEVDGFSSFVRQIKGVEIGVTIKEKTKTFCKVSIRTSGNYDASMICSMFGGGGHKNAAGCIFNTGVEDALSKLLEQIKKIIDGV